MAVVRQGPLVDADQAERIERLKITKAINDSAGTEQKSPVGNPPTGGSYLERTIAWIIPALPAAAIRHDNEYSVRIWTRRTSSVSLRVSESLSRITCSHDLRDRVPEASSKSISKIPRRKMDCL